MNTIKLDCFQITIEWDGENRKAACIRSSMKELDTFNNHDFNTGVDAIEAMVLAHFCAGIDVSEPCYLEGIETAYLALGNHSEIISPKHVTSLAEKAVNQMGDIFWDAENFEGDHALPRDVAVECVENAIGLALNKYGSQLGTIRENIVADFEIQDTFIMNGEATSRMPDSHKDTYRLVVRKGSKSDSLSFSVYPKALDGVSDNIPRIGLEGFIEVRNGKPGISLGTHEDSTPLHVEADGVDGIFLHHDANVEPMICHRHNHHLITYFKGYHLRCNSQQWLSEARSEIAEQMFADHDFGEKIVEDSEGWECLDHCWIKTVFYQNPLGGDSIKGKYTIIFESESTMIATQIVD